MEKERLKEYLRKVVDLETLLYKNQNLLADVDTSLATATGSPYTWKNGIVDLTLEQEYINMPQPKDVPKSIFEYTPQKSEFIRGFDKWYEEKNVLRRVLWILSIIGLCSSPCTGLTAYAMFDSDTIGGVPIALGLIVIIILSFVGVIVFPCIKAKAEDREYSICCTNIAKRNQQRGEQYYARLLDEWDYENQNIVLRNEEKKKVAKEMQMLRVSLEENLSNLESQLQEEYDKNIIYPKYRNFVAVTSLYEYIESGICTSLEGADGAYKLYEDHVRQNMIITHLGKIAAGLDMIRKNQYCMYVQMKDIENSMYEMQEIAREINDCIQETVTTNELMLEYTQKMQNDMRLVRNLEVIDQFFD